MLPWRSGSPLCCMHCDQLCCMHCNQLCCMHCNPASRSYCNAIAAITCTAGPGKPFAACQGYILSATSEDGQQQCLITNLTPVFWLTMYPKCHLGRCPVGPMLTLCWPYVCWPCAEPMLAPYLLPPGLVFHKEEGIRLAPRPGLPHLSLRASAHLI